MVKVYMTSSINFVCKVCGKNVNDNDRAIQCELCNYGFTSIAITLIILTIKFFKIPMILGIAFSVVVRFSHLILWKVIDLEDTDSSLEDTDSSFANKKETVPPQNNDEIIYEQSLNNLANANQNIKSQSQNLNQYLINRLTLNQYLNSQSLMK